MSPYPGKDGKADYCGYKAHLYEIGALSGSPNMRCKNCGYVKRGKPKV